ncbi:hypothetical protein GW932_00680 [archaeon]|nr:hypothetical protein [archaeon]
MNIHRDVNLARKAYKKKDIELMKRAHDSKEIHKTERGKYLRSWIWGGLDGVVTTFAVVAGVAGASLSSTIVLILGFANLIADGISMAVGDYLSTKSEKEYYDLERERETWEVKNYPKGERDEMLEVYTKKGYSQKEANKLVNILSKNKKFWIDTMMHEELGLMHENESPKKNAIFTFISFLIFGFIPLLIYVLGSIFNFTINRGFLYASILSGSAMFLLGSVKTKITGKKWYKSGFETLLIGGIAATAAYFVGDILARIL